MANNIAAEFPVLNDGILWCEIERDVVNPTTGDIETEGVEDAEDVEAFFSTTKELSSSVEIHADLRFELAPITGTNRYFVYPQGDVMASRLLPTYKDVKVYIHFIKGNGDWHEVAETTIVDERAAT